MLAVVGNLSIDRIEGGPPQIGGGPYHAARALRLLNARSEVVARCANADRRALLPRLAALGIPLHMLRGMRTTAFSFEYEGDTRLMTVDAIGDAWTPRDAHLVDRRIRWLHVAPLLRSDFPVETVAELARGRRLIFDAHGLVRRAQVGPLAGQRDELRLVILSGNEPLYPAGRFQRRRHRGPGRIEHGSNELF